MGVFVLGLSLLCLEALLQVLSFGTYLRVSAVKEERSEQGSGSRDREVICVGDSFTFGFGATGSQYSYPAQLELVLEEGTGDGWTVHSVCEPGWNSEQMANALASKLAAVSPEFVLLIGGVNDEWSGAKMVKESALREVATGEAPVEEENGFRWEWRTAKLLKTLRQEDAFVAEAEVGEIAQASATSGGRSEVKAQQQAEAAVVEAPKENPCLAAWALLESGKFAEAATAFESVPSEFISEYDRAHGIVNCYRELGRGQELDPQIAILRKGLEDQPDQERAERYIAALAAAWKNEELAREAVELGKRFPESFEIAFRHGFVLMTGADVGPARVQFDRAAAILGEDIGGHGLASWFWKNRAASYGAGTNLPPVAEEVAYSFVCEYLSGGSKEMTLQGFLHTVNLCDEGVVRRALERSSATPDQKAEILAIHQNAVSGDLEAKAIQVTTHNFGVMSELAKSKGSRVLLSTYPFHKPILATMSKIVSQEHKTLFARIDDDFLRAIETEGREAIFVPDGHCNDRGYRMMAELIGEKLLRELREKE